MRLALHLEINGLLDTIQFGFRKNISAVDALRRVLDYIAESKELGNLSCLLIFGIKSTCLA